MKRILAFLLVVTAALLLVALTGCQDSSGSGMSAASITGQVTNNDGVGMPDVNVITTDGTNTWTAVTDENGNYTLLNVLPGAKIIAFYAPGYVTQYVSVVVGASPVVGDASLLSDPGNPPEGAPGMSINEPTINQTSGTAGITGQITGLNVDQAVLIVNGNPSLINTDGSGDFNTTVILNPGENTIYLWAVNGVGATLSLPISATWAPEGNVYFKVTLTWDGLGDLDLHNWDPNLAHCYYDNTSIATGTLDVDNQDGYGPENFTCTSLVNGRFRVAANSYYASSRNATIRVSVFSGPNAGHTYTFGPYQLTTSNENGDYPITGSTASWWRPCDVLVNGSTISVVSPDSTSLNESATMVRGSKKK